MTNHALENRFMEFLLGDQSFAIPLISVKEVIQRPDITSVPNMPAYFEGMINLRGKIIGVFNVRKKLSLKQHASKIDAGPEVVIVVEMEGVSVGMIVDEVRRVIHATEDMISPAPLREDDPAHKYVVNVIRLKNDMVLSMDAGKLLEIEKYRRNLAS